jgi:hypothetical protein
MPLLKINQKDTMNLCEIHYQLGIIAGIASESKNDQLRDIVVKIRSLLHEPKVEPVVTIESVIVPRPVDGLTAELKPEDLPKRSANQILKEKRKRGNLARLAEFKGVDFRAVPRKAYCQSPVCPALNRKHYVPDMILSTDPEDERTPALYCSHKCDEIAHQNKSITKLEEAKDFPHLYVEN